MSRLVLLLLALICSTSWAQAEDAQLGGIIEPLKTPAEAATPNLIATGHATFCRVESKSDMRVTSTRIALAAVKGSPLENVVDGDETRPCLAPGLEGVST